MRADHDDAPAPADAPPLATLRAVSGRWLLDAAPEGRISINGVPVAGARIVIAGDVITIAGSQFLVEEAQPRTLALRRFDLEGTDTLAAGRRQRAYAGGAGRRTCPSSLARCRASRAPPRRARARVPRHTLNYLAWAMGVVLVAVLGVFTLLKPIALDLRPGRRGRSLASAASPGNRPRACSCSRASTRCAPSAPATNPPRSRCGSAAPRRRAR